MMTGEDIFQWLSRMTEDERKATRGMLFDRQWLADGADSLEDPEARRMVDELPGEAIGEAIGEAVDDEFDGEAECRAQYCALMNLSGRA